MSNTAEVGSREVKVKVAVHLSKLAVIGRDEFRLSRMELCTGVTSKTGAWARDSGESKAVTARQKTVRRMTEVWPQAGFLSIGKWV